MARKKRITLNRTKTQGIRNGRDWEETHKMGRSRK
jgi:hypothetical protein